MIAHPLHELYLRRKRKVIIAAGADQLPRAYVASLRKEPRAARHHVRWEPMYPKRPPTRTDRRNPETALFRLVSQVATVIVK